MGNYVPIGKGPNDVLDVIPITQFWKSGDDLITLLNGFNDDKLLYWNISKSLAQKETVYDSIIPFRWKSEQRYVPFMDMFIVGKDSMYVYWHPRDIRGEAPSLPIVELRGLRNGQSIKEIKVFKNSIYNEKSQVYLSDFFNTSNFYKPDGSKMVQGMSKLAQINIIDLNSDEIKGYRLKSSNDFSIFYGDMRNSVNTYYRITTNNDYIFLLWDGEKFAPVNSKPKPVIQNIIHVFDWDGNFVKKLKIPQSIQQLCWDEAQDVLYGYSIFDEELYRYDVSAVL